MYGNHAVFINNKTKFHKACCGVYLVMPFAFSTNYEEIISIVDKIDPIAYGKTRNYLDGAVTRLSPYISRGVISTKYVLQKKIEQGYKLYEIESFVKELCWRDYFQRIAQHKDINTDIKQTQAPVAHYQIPKVITDSNTGIHALDAAIQDLYETGYMHNHCRMYIAFLACNLAQSHWLMPARWMYYHLLDADWASNACSWQWVAGANSSKKYITNQENINKYTKTNQKGTYLDADYEAIANLSIPQELTEAVTLNLPSTLPETNIEIWNEQRPTFIYNYYNLDPNWHKNEEGNRVLLLEPHHFDQYPISPKSVSFLLALTNNIPNIQIYTGAFESFAEKHKTSTCYFKEHPFNQHYQGICEPRDWICEEANGYYPSFFAYWKKAERIIKKLFENKTA